jgi:hypothetical protein
LSIARRSQLGWMEVEEFGEKQRVSHSIDVTSQFWSAKVAVENEFTLLSKLTQESSVSLQSRAFPHAQALEPQAGMHWTLHLPPFVQSRLPPQLGLTRAELAIFRIFWPMPRRQ